MDSLPICMLSSTSKGLLSAHDKLDAMLKTLSSIVTAVGGLDDCSVKIENISRRLESVERISSLEETESKYLRILEQLSDLGLTEDDLQDISQILNTHSSTGQTVTQCGYSAAEIAAIKRKLDALLRFFELTENSNN